jgi:hypothetical protein
MSHETIQDIALIIIAIGVLAQAAVTVGGAMALAKFRKPVRQFADNVIEISGIVRERAHDVDATVAKISDAVMARTEQADVIAKELLEKSRWQVLHADQAVSRMIDRAEELSRDAERLVKKPFWEASAIAKGVRTALGHALHGNSHDQF